MSNNLNKAKAAKNDEFYTQYKDIEKECQHYVEHFKDQWIYLPCDTEDSNFWKYFIDHFNEYGLKRLTATHINLDGTPSYRLDYDGLELTKTALNGNGDFKSEECTIIKNECDMVITNPPFSLFREFIKWLQDNTLQIKKFLVIGNTNAAQYQDVFPLIKQNKIWSGTQSNMDFINTNNELKNLPCCWYTNLGNNIHTPINLYKHYNANEYPKYDDYNAINVNKILNIPIDYNGLIGVPITFIKKHCKEQFEIIDEINKPFINGKPIYKRLIIKKKIDK